MRMTATRYAAQVMLRKLTLDDVPEIRQRAVQHIIARLGPVGQSETDEDLVVGLMRRIEQERAR